MKNTCNMFASNLCRLMTERNVQPKNLALAIGMIPTNINQIIAGDVSPTLEQFVAIADYFGVPADQLLGRVVQDKMSMPIDEMDLSVRAWGVLHRNGVNTLGEMLDFVKDGRMAKAIHATAAVRSEIMAKLQELVGYRPAGNRSE